MRLAIASALGLFALGGVTACTFFSGVEELEVRDHGAAGQDASVDSSTSKSPPPFSSGGNVIDGGGPTKAPVTGKQCGAQGSWMPCEVPDTLATCGQRCQAKGLTCVESCCAHNDAGVFNAKAGMVYATPGLTCELSSVPSNSSAGLCNDPVLPIGAGVMDVRCCCR